MESCGYGFSAMSSVCEVRLDGAGDAAQALAAQAAIAEVRRIELK